jgi:UPF0271 protein
MKRILDASFFFADYRPPGELFTTPSVIDELVDLQAKCRYENFLSQGLTVRVPAPRYLAAVSLAAQKTGDSDVLSAADRDLLALALELGGSLLTDDFAVQNVAQALGITVVPLRERRAAAIRWKFRCTGCGRYYQGGGECPVCGAIIKRRLK